MATRRLRVVAALLAAAFAACVQNDGRLWTPRRMIEVSEDREREIGFEFDAWARENLELIDDPVVMGFLNDLGQTMVRTVEPQPYVYRFRVIRDSRLNAFAVPGGYVFFHSATLLSAGSVDELAGVLGHEIAHVKARHYARGVEKSAVPALLTQLAAIGATAATGHPAPMIVGMGLNVAFQLKYTREFEQEADRYGAVFVTRVGYDVRGIARFFDRILQEEQRLPPGAEIPPYLFTHPDVEDRIAAVLVSAETLRPVTQPDPSLEQAFREAQARLYLLEASERTALLGAQLPPESARSDPALRLADQRAQQGDIDGALAVLAGAERAVPDDPRLPFRRGELLEEADRRDEAIAAYRRAVDLDPTTGLTLYKLGRAYAEAGDRHRGVYYLEQSLLHLGATSTLRKRAEAEIERVTFPVMMEAGLSGSFGESPGLAQGEFAPGSSVFWWGRVSPRHGRRREEIVASFRGPDASVVQQAPVRERDRPLVEARLDLPGDAVPGTWSVEIRLEETVVDRRSFRVAAQPAAAP